MNDKKAFCAVIILFFLIMSFLLSPYLDSGLPGLISQMSADGFKLKIQLGKNTLRCCLLSLVMSFAVISAVFPPGDEQMKSDEFGSASFGDARRLNEKYRDTEGCGCKILSKNVSISLNGFSHRRNVNVLVCGGSGSGKTRYYAKPNVMNADCSMIVLDPKGEIVRSTGHLLEEKGYTVKAIDLINMEKSCCYNPFSYLRDENDVQRMCTNLFANTTPKKSQSSDPFWDKAAMMLLLAIVFYLIYEAPSYEQNFPMVMEMIRAGEVRENDESYRSVLDELFFELPDGHTAKKYYMAYRSGNAKTLKSIQISLISHLEKFNLSSLAAITSYDELNLDSVGEKKTAIFAVTSENDTSFNFLIGMLYTQLFQRLYYIADKKYKGALPVHVHFNMDEFANVPLPDDFDKILSTMRSRGISVSIIIQNMAQLKNLYRDEWESIVGNCDEFVYLGGNELSTHEYVSKLIGKQTIKYETHSKSRGKSGSYSTTEYVAARSVMNPDEVRMLDNGKCLLFIRGEKCVKDDKFDLMRHKNISLTTDGGYREYDYGIERHYFAFLTAELSSRLRDEGDEERDTSRYEITSAACEEGKGGDDG